MEITPSLIRTNRGRLHLSIYLFNAHEIPAVLSAKKRLIQHVDKNKTHVMMDKRDIPRKSSITMEKSTFVCLAYYKNFKAAVANQSHVMGQWRKKKTSRWWTIEETIEAVWISDDGAINMYGCVRKGTDGCYHKSSCPRVWDYWLCPSVIMSFHSECN